VRRLGGLDPRAVARVRRVAGVASVAVVRSGTAFLRDGAPAGHGIPVDVLAVPPAYGALVGGLPALRPGQALLSRTSARLRGGARTLRFAGGLRLRVVGVVDDGLVRAAEVVVSPADGARLGIRQQSVYVTGSPRLRALERAGGRGTRVRRLGPAPWGRIGGGTALVARPAETKARFGEFAVRLPAGRDWVRLERGWVARNIVSRPVPVLGRVTCHRAMLPALARVLRSLERRGLDRLVDRGDYAGCHAPRRIPTSGSMSQHAWGLAVDLNASENPYGAEPAMDMRIVRAFRREGFVWGGDWPTPDGMHFEYRGEPVRAP